MQPRKEEKAFAKRGSILGAFTASISEALSSSTASQPVATAPSAAADASDSIFSVLKRKSSALSDAIFNPSEVAGDSSHLTHRFTLKRASRDIAIQGAEVQTPKADIRPLPPLQPPPQPPPARCLIRVIRGASTRWCSLCWRTWDQRHASVFSGAFLFIIELAGLAAAFQRARL